MKGNASSHWNEVEHVPVHVSLAFCPNCVWECHDLCTSSPDGCGSSAIGCGGRTIFRKQSLSRWSPICRLLVTATNDVSPTENEPVLFGSLTPPLGGPERRFMLLCSPRTLMNNAHNLRIRNRAVTSSALGYECGERCVTVHVPAAQPNATAGRPVSCCWRALRKDYHSRSDQNTA